MLVFPWMAGVGLGVSDRTRGNRNEATCGRQIVSVRGPVVSMTEVAKPRHGGVTPKYRQRQPTAS
jgi:hypothetical protein